MDKCQSCGMPMDKPEDYGGGRAGNTYCQYCADDQGNLLPRETVREKMIQFQMKSLNKSQEQAEGDVDRHMALMPAWQGGGVSMPDEPKMPGSPVSSAGEPASTDTSQGGPVSPVGGPTDAGGGSITPGPADTGSTGGISDVTPPVSPSEPSEPVSPAEPVGSSTPSQPAVPGQPLQEEPVKEEPPTGGVGQSTE